MNYFCLALLCAVTSTLASPAPATHWLKASSSITFTQSDSNLEVVRFTWTKERINWEADPFSGPIENFDEARARARNEKRIAEAKRGGGSERINRDAKADSAIVATQHRVPESRYVFMYKVTVKNLSDKTIKSVDWDYIFIDKSTNQELARHEFTSEEKIGPGKTKDLVVTLSKPPTARISLTALNSSEREGLIGQVFMVRVDYSDGTSWQRP